ncbi:PepSY-like domain-containing protein [bacterium]|nr:PepSY-like domain-containing protein [bacterium]
MRALVVLSATALLTVAARGDEEPVSLDKLPKAVVAAVQKRFPKVEMTGASKEKDGDTVVFEVSLKKDGKTIDVTVTEAGAVTLIEQELAFKDLPKAVAKTFGEKYAGAKYEVIESVTKVANGKETLAYYESTLASGGKRWEVEVLPDGTVKAATEVKDKK